MSHGQNSERSSQSKQLSWYQSHLTPYNRPIDQHRQRGSQWPFSPIPNLSQLGPVLRSRARTIAVARPSPVPTSSSFDGPQHPEQKIRPSFHSSHTSPRMRALPALRVPFTAGYWPLTFPKRHRKRKLQLPFIAPELLDFLERELSRKISKDPAHPAGSF